MKRSRAIVLVTALVLTGVGTSADARRAEPVVTDSNPLVSWDSSAITFYRDSIGGGGVYVTTPTGSGTRPLPGLTDKSVYAFSRRWHWIAYVDDRVGVAPALTIARPDESERRIVAVGGIGGLSWAPDGGRLVFVRDGVLFTIGVDGGDERRIAPGRSPTWSPDGTRLAYLLEDGVYVRELESGATRRVGDSPGLAPHWSPDSRHVAWISDRIGRLAVATVATGRVAHYRTHRYPFGLAWAANGRSLAYAASGRLPGERGVYRLDLSRPTLRAQVRLSNLAGFAGEKSVLDWAPNGRWLVVTAFGTCTTRLGLYRVSADRRGAPVRLTNRC